MIKILTPKKEGTMKLTFWLTFVVLITGISCNAPMKTKTLPDASAEKISAGESNLVQAIAGTYTLKTGVFHGISMRSNITDMTLKLCSNGKFLIRYASPNREGTDWGATSSAQSQGRPIGRRGSWDATENTRIRGTWHVEGTPARGKLTLNFRRGNVEIYIYEVKQKGWLNFHGADFWRMGSAHCR